MKKLLTISILATMLILLVATKVDASSKSLADDLYGILSKYGMTTSDKAKVKRYVSDYSVTDSQADEIVAIAKKAVTVFENAGKTNYADLTAGQKAELKELAKQAASVVDVVLVFDEPQLRIYKNGKLLDVVTERNGKLVYTGSSKDLADDLYSILSKYGMTTSDRVKVKRYVSDYSVTDSQADEIVAIAKKAVAIFENAGKTNYDELTAAQKAELKNLAKQAADVVGVVLVFDEPQLRIYKNGKLIDVVTEKNGKLVYTGNNNVVLVVSSIAVIALASVLVTRKNLANA